MTKVASMQLFLLRRAEPRHIQDDEFLDTKTFREKMIDLSTECCVRETEAQSHRCDSKHSCTIVHAALPFTTAFTQGLRTFIRYI